MIPDAHALGHDALRADVTERSDANGSAVYLRRALGQHMLDRVVRIDLRTGADVAALTDREPSGPVEEDEVLSMCRLRQ